MAQRFRDTGASRYELGGRDVLVVCPRCSARATVIAAPGGSRRRLVCGACAFVDERRGTRSVWGPPVDPWFEQPLWLTERFGEHVVWAYHREHAQLLRDYVAADQRVRAGIPGSTMLERLPAWFKERGNRDAITAILDRLIARADSG